MTYPILRLATAVVFIGTALMAAADLYDKHGNRTGEIKESTPGQYEIFDTHGNRLGYGQRSPYDSRTIDLYDQHWNRTGEIKTDRPREDRKK